LIELTNQQPAISHRQQVTGNEYPVTSDQQPAQST